MSDFLTLNDYAVPIKDGGASVKPIDRVAGGRSFDGSFLESVMWRKNQWTMSTTIMSYENGEALLHLLQGEGHVWNFDAATGTNWQYSSKGRGAASGVADGSRVSPSIKFGEGYLRITAGDQVTWSTFPSDDYTLMVWAGTSATHYIVRSDGAKWENGVRNDSAATPFLYLTSEVLYLGDPSSAGNQKFDDLVYLPFKISADMATAFGTMTKAFGQLPKVRAKGMFNNEANQGVRIRNISADYAQFNSSGTWSLGYQISFRMDAP